MKLYTESMVDKSFNINNELELEKTFYFSTRKAMTMLDATFSRN